MGELHYLAALPTYFPRVKICHRVGKPTSKPLSTLRRREANVLILDDPRQELDASIEIRWWGHRLEHCRQALVARKVVQHMAKLLNDSPRERMIRT